MTAVEVLERWFEAHARSDMDAARSLMADDAVVTVADGTAVRGFDEFMGWYDARREQEGNKFSYEVVDLLGGANHAAAVILLRRDGSVRRQVAVYEISEDRITSVQLFEDEAGPS